PALRAFEDRDRKALEHPRERQRVGHVARENVSPSAGKAEGGCPPQITERKDTRLHECGDEARNDDEDFAAATKRADVAIAVDRFVVAGTEQLRAALAKIE